MVDLAAGKPGLPLKVHLAMMNVRTQALLEYYIQHNGQNIFDLVGSQEVADAVVVDYDFAGTRPALHAEQWSSELPRIVLAYGKPVVDNAVLVSKPFDWVSLEAAARRVLELPEQVAHGHSPGESVKSEPGPPAAALNPAAEAVAAADRHRAARVASVERQRQQTRLALLCGPARSLAELAARDDPAHRFLPEQYLSDRVRRAIARRGPNTQAIRLALPDFEVYVLCWLRKVCLTLSLRRSGNVERVFRAFDDAELQSENYGSNRVRELASLVNAQARCAFSIEAFYWVSALFAARGRLPMGLSVDEPMQLVYWPNFTRLDTIPACMDLASAWSTQPRSLREVVDTVRCEARFASAFVNGTLALGLMDTTLEEASRVPYRDKERY